MGFFRWLLKILPVDFRREYGDELELTVREQERDLSRGFGAHLRFWCRQYWAILRVAVELRAGVGQRRVAAQRGARHRLGSTITLDNLWSEGRQGFRALVKRPGYFSVGAVTIALAVGASTAMFSTVYSTLVRPLPYRAPEEIVVLKTVSPVDGTLSEGLSAANLRDLVGVSESLSHAAVAANHGLRWLENGRASSLKAWMVSEGFFQAIGAEASHGRLFRAEEFQAGQEHVVILHNSTWKSRFGGDPDILGRAILLDGAPHVVIGVLPAEFQYPAAADLWTPRPPQPWDDRRRAGVGLETVARLAPGFTRAEAEEELGQLAARLAVVFPQANADLEIKILPLREHLFGDVSTPLWLLLGAACLVLLVAAGNLAGLQWVRSVGRARELGLRGALGASTGQNLRLVAMESLILALTGGALGLLLAESALRTLRVLALDSLPRLDALRLDGPAFIFALLAALVTVLLAGWGPIFISARGDLAGSLRVRSHGAGDAGSTASRSRWVVAQIALALVLGISAGLLVRSLERLQDVPIGFDPEGRLAVQVWAYDDQHRARHEYFERGLQSLAALPGVESVGLTTDLPMADDRTILSREREMPFRVAGGTVPKNGESPSAWLASIDAQYPEALGIALRAGRSFSRGDREETAPVAMINVTFAKRFFPNQEVVGRKIILGSGEGQKVEIVGVLADVLHGGFESKPRPEIYRPLSQAPSAGLTFVIKTSQDPEALYPMAKEALADVDPGQAIWAHRSQEALLRDWNRHRHFLMTLLLTFAGLALVLATIGVYGLTSFSLLRRQHEMGVRRALGGQTRDLVALLVRRSLILSGQGVALGLCASLLTTHLLRGLLFEIAPFDLPTFAVLTCAVILTTTLAAYFPARRAARVDPMDSLRVS